MISSGEIPPGGVGDIEVTLHTENKRGKQKRVITVTSSDPVTPKFDLMILADIQAEFAFTTRQLVFGGLYENEAVTQNVQIEVVDKKIVKIEEIRTSAPFVTAKLVEGSAADSTDFYEIAVTVAPDSAVARFNEYVYVRSNLADKSEIKLLVYGYVMAGEKPDE